MIIGPVLAIPAAIVSDFLGVLIWDGLGTYFAPFVLQEIGSSLIWALLLYRSKVSTWRVMLGRFAICLLINIALGTPLLILYQNYAMGSSSLVLTWPRIFKNMFMFPIESLVMTIFLSVMIPITSRMGLTYFKAPAKLGFNKAQIATLCLLLVVGVGAVFGYLDYHYDTTTLSSSYGDTRADHNKEMLPLLIEASDEFDDKTVVTIIDSAYQKFLTNEITYTVSIYAYDNLTEDVLEDCWALSKSGPTKGIYPDILTKLGVATMVVNDKTGELLSIRLSMLK